MSARRSFYVYEAVTGDGQVLYVGATTDPTMRIRHHRSKSWWPQVARWALTACDTRAEMETLERARIGELNPVGNTNLNGGRTRADRGEVRALIMEILESCPTTTTELRRALDGYPNTPSTLQQMYLAGAIKPVAWTKGGYRGGWMATWAPADSASPEAMHPTGRMRWQITEDAEARFQRAAALTQEMYT